MRFCPRPGAPAALFLQLIEDVLHGRPLSELVGCLLFNWWLLKALALVCAESRFLYAAVEAAMRPCHILLQVRQPVLHLRVRAECLFEPGVDAFPHQARPAFRARRPGGHWRFATRSTGDAPEGVHALPQQRADLQHLGMPLAGVVVAVLRVAVLAEGCAGWT